ncbi:T9SS type B sorting domain-containing protein [Flagellimonas algicola]|uniref:T9SS type B sorting domain-containing protein n=1 Tax=Flagellimonas algicola TaxID=2583815 RepID=A0ABY2WM97_9FLAO|nr:T9SS type B sorting domain-containing protein [Allomuricauda algicola]TMU55656.1 T9SS type B sorting domain-containing protein [Allomuricauda algicola]
MNLRLFCAAIALLFSVHVQSQLEASIWYFGTNAGLDFRSGAPVALEDGELVTKEGCATISDPLGNLLFYTDGSTVWNRNHIIMPNGTGLLGNSTSSQSAIIVPKPNDSNIFYIITVSYEGVADGVNYSEVDMGLNGGLGDVTVKNVHLYGPSMEKLTAVEHANGRDIWVITHDWANADFLTYLVTPAGVNTTPVVSTVGMDLSGSLDTTAAIGYLKASPDGTKVAVSHRDAGSELLDFDTTTGILSNPILLTTEGMQYGVEFSPSSKILYLSPFTEFLYQYDLTAADIPGSAININENNVGEAALQLGIDGKIYATNFLRNTLSVIHDPNVLGLGCNYEFAAIDLGSGEAFWGLPPFIQSFFFISDIQADNLCLGDTTEFSINVSEPIVSISWDFGDGNTSTDENPTHTYTFPGNYTVSVTVTTASETQVETRDIVISEVPVANPVTDPVVCNATNTYNFDLSTLDTEVLGTQSATDFVVSYHTILADADTNSNPMSSISTFGLGATPVFVRISNRADRDCYDTTAFTINIYLQPSLHAVTDWTVCDDDTDGVYNFDLTSKDAEVLNGQDVSTFAVSYHSSQTDADNRANALGASYINTLPVETLFFRIENSGETDCYETGSFAIEVIEQVVANTPVNLEICDTDNNGNATFDLSLVETEIIGAQNPASLVISYHSTKADADANTNPLATNFDSTNYQETIYVRLANASNLDCYDTTSFQLLIFDTPVVSIVSDWYACDDDNDGVLSFDLTEKTSEILSSFPSGTVSFHETQNDADLDQNPIVGNYFNTANPQTIYFRIENSGNANCYNLGQFQIQVFDTPSATMPMDIVVCDVDETGRYTFDLGQKDLEILNGQAPNVFEVLYFSSEMDALNNTNALLATAYNSNSASDVIYARVHNPLFSDCFAITNFSVLINPLPQIGLQDTYVICPDSPDLTIQADIFESYEWTDSAGQVLGNAQEQFIAALGNYSLTVTETTNGVTCTNAFNFEVVSSGAPDSFTVSTDGVSDEITLTVDAVGIGTFEYSIDGINYQTDNQFMVFPGRYIVYVRDPFECRTLSQEIIALGYQKFFSPNGDNHHEYWNVIGAEQFPNSLLFIYDRLGKLLCQISPQGQGWDGTYLRRPMPASDYWFRFEYGEGEVLTGHFTLKR